MATKKYPEAIAHYPNSMQLFIKKIYNRIESGRNALIIVIGQTGSGKSLSAVSISMGLHLYRYGKMPSVEEVVGHCIFKASDFMKEMNNPNLKKKEVWVWDEAGVDIGHKDHASKHNKVIGWLAQTFRNLQQVVFFTVPSISFVDASVRKLLHYQLETLSINKSKKIAIIKPLELQYNNRQDKLYYHNLRFNQGDGFMHELNVMGIPIPPPDYEKDYEEKKSKFTTALNVRIQEMLEEGENSGGNYMKYNHKKIFELYHNHSKVQKEIAEQLGVSPRNVGKVMVTMDKKYNNWRENSELLLGKVQNEYHEQNSQPIQLNSQEEGKIIVDNMKGGNK
jgi:energy-coupling factor transporter ATP-binding protein EcfA2|tara:strand:+ start:10714 stop:11721 length:1008 start_codon:yes stop_codon:yes gene_type:complete